MPKRTDVFSQFEHIRERMDQAYQRVIGAPGRPHFTVSPIEPPTDVYETEQEVIILMEIAGIADEEVELELEGATLSISGERKPVPGRPDRVYSQMEICDGHFRRDILLPAEVNADEAKAVYKDGMLEIVLPKAGPTPTRQLRITVR